MELISYYNGELLLQFESNVEQRYSRTVSNQLILSARMNDWGHFTSLWKRKTDPSVWLKVESFSQSLSSGQRWKIKEAFARLATQEEEKIEPSQVIAKKIELSFS